MNSNHPNHPSATPAFILASQSPRRGELLREAGYTITQQTPPFSDPDQPEDDCLDAQTHAIHLAQAKAHSLAKQIDYPAIILSADTLCVDENDRLIGKPADRKHAFAMLQGFVNAEHAVVSGVAILDTRNAAETPPTCFADRAVVRFGPIPDEEIQAYLDLNHWQGKAGGYNLFDRQHAGWPITVTGDPTTVVGLPMRKIIPILTRIGIYPMEPGLQEPCL